MQKNSFLSVGEKHIKCKIALMSWSSKRDLIALATDKGDAFLYRLSALERVWSLPPAEKDARINAICWRPDGSVIAIGYSSKENGIKFVYMEKFRIVWSLNEDNACMERPVTSLKWAEYCGKNEDKDLEASRFSSLSFKDFLPELPKLSSKDVTITDVKSIVGNCRFHILLACDDINTITLFAYGIFPLIKIPCIAQPEKEVTVIDMCLSPDFKFVTSVVMTTNESKMSCDLLLYDITNVTDDVVLCERAAHKSCYLNTILVYLGNVLDSMNESCETVVQEMESKLTKYLLNKNLSGTIGDEFMHLLMWGKPNDVLEELLTTCVTEKGIMKLGTLVEASYTSIHQLLLVNFQLAADAVYYHLNEIKGMSAMTVLGHKQLFDSTLVCDVIKCAGTFMLKASEMQQIIGKSLKNFKAFFRWLYSSLLKIHETSLDSVTQMSTKELEFVADFIMESFIHEHEQLKISGREKHFNLDKVYQYLQDSPLTSPQAQDGNEWFRLVDATPSLSGNDLILDRRPDASLRQLYVELRSKIRLLLNCSSVDISKERIVQQSFIMTSQLPFKPHSCQWFQIRENQTGEFYTFLGAAELPYSDLILVRTPLNERPSQMIRINFNKLLSDCDETNQCLVAGFDRYNENHLTLLLRANSSSMLAQLSWPSLLKDLIDCGAATNICIDASEHVTHSRTLDPMVPVMVAASGTRKVSCVLDANLRHIRAYEMDQTSEDGEDDLDVSLQSV